MIRTTIECKEATISRFVIEKERKNFKFEKIIELVKSNLEMYQ